MLISTLIVYVASSPVMLTVSSVERMAVNRPINLEVSFELGPEADSSSVFCRKVGACRRRLNRPRLTFGRNEPSDQSTSFRPVGTALSFFIVNEHASEFLEEADAERVGGGAFAVC